MGEIEGDLEFFSSQPPVDPNLIKQMPHENEEPLVYGEDPGTDISRATARHVNSKVSRSSENEHIDLGELGEHMAKDTRYRDSAKQGFLTAYIRTRETASEHKVVTTITVSTIAIGAVLTGIRAIKHRRK